jgi:ABC-type phosphate/phosphonate transport system permease subunit
MITRAEEADRHVLEALRRMGTPCTFNAITLATPQVSAPRISQALARLVRRFVQVTRWTVSAINPETSWRRI